MKMKKILAGVLAGAISITSVVVTSLTINAAAVTSIPSGSEKVLYTATLDKTSMTGQYTEMGTAGITISDTSIMENENVYAKLVVSNYGTFTGDDGVENTAVDMLKWWGDMTAWLIGVKWYNDYSEPTGQFDVNFYPILTDDEQIVSYVPISDFELDEYDQIVGNLQNGSFSSVEIASLQIVEFGEAELDENGEVALSKNEITFEALQK